MPKRPIKETNPLRPRSRPEPDPDTAPGVRKGLERRELREVPRAFDEPPPEPK